jgi:hypothetical protein
VSLLVVSSLLLLTIPSSLRQERVVVQVLANVLEGSYNNTGMSQDLSRILTNGYFDIDKYCEYLPLFLSSTFAMPYGALFCGVQRGDHTCFPYVHRVLSRVLAI